MPVLTQEAKVDPRENVVTVSFMKVGKTYNFDFGDYPNLAIGDRIIAYSRYLGEQMGEVKGFIARESLSKDEQIYSMLRRATPADLLNLQQWQEQEVPALIDCRERAAEMGGYKEVKFVAAEYNYNGTILTFFYTMEDHIRVNIHRIRNAMRKQFSTIRIEFRQIGPRDVAKLQGGFGACGIPRCCSTFLTDFSMVSINMAKAQGVSLSPAEITGMCGRLRCCLSYEYEQYVEARRQLPRLRKRVGTEHGVGVVVEIHPMQDAVTVRVDEENYLITREELKPLEEWEALQRAAASPCSKNESGGCDCGAKRPRGSEEDLMKEMGLEPDDNQAQKAQENEHEDASSRHRRRRNKRNKSRRKKQGAEQKNNQSQKQSSNSENSSSDDSGNSKSGSSRNKRGRRKRGRRGRGRGQSGQKRETNSQNNKSDDNT